MIALIQFNIVLLAAAMSIGVVTGWWMFGRRPASPRQPEDDEPT
ncbi:MAG TPA: hypothetical protein VLK25_12435 [Allosphingosinicella sp.]|nr:hypothetical protein [Allosphingosinicella sp.]